MRMILLLCCLSFTACLAAEPTTNPADPVLSIPPATTPPQIDGRLDDPAWQHAAVIGPFVGPIRATGKDLPRPEYRTEARLLWDPSTLYIAFLCHGPSFHATFHQHDDPLHEQDVAEVFLDVAGDHLQYAEFQVSPLATTADWYHLWSQHPTYPVDQIDWAQTKNHQSDLRWNLPGLQSAAGPLLENDKPAGWVIELAIPLADLLKKRNLPDRLRPGQTLHLNLLRYIYEPNSAGQRDHRHLNWSPTLKGCPHVSPMALQPIRCTN